MSNRVATFIKDWWPVIMVLGAFFVTMIESRYQINQLMNDKEINKNQWTAIYGTATTVTGLLEKHIAIDKVITPASMQTWGKVQDAVERHEADIRSLEDKLNNLR